MRLTWVTLALLVPACSLYFGDDAPPADDPPPVALARCAPGPASRASVVAPDLRAWILEAEASGCALDRRTSAGAADGFPTTLDVFAAPGTITCDAAGCWRALPAFGKAWGEHPAPAAFTYRQDPLGEQWVGMVQAERNQTTGELRATLVAMTYGSSAVRRFERRWDTFGHLLGERESFGGAPWFTTDNVWDDGRLVGSRFTDTVNGTGVTTYAWTYDGGRLVGATARHADSGAEAHAQLAYDDAGRLVSIDRTLGGAPTARQTWSYAGDVVARATTTLEPSTSPDAWLVAATDDLAPVTYASTQGEWDLADGLVATRDGCAPLPHALVHGYPAADGAYALGWAVGDRPAGIDGDYGFGNVYDSGMDRWFGHDRVEAYVFNQPWSDTAVSGELVYDAAGRMIVEHVATADGAIDAVRTRRFDGGALRSDERVLHRDDATLTSALAFTHDDDGRLVERTYRLDGHLAGRHRWSYDGAAIRRHTIEEAGLPPGQAGFPMAIPDLSLLPDELPAPIVHERVTAGGDETWLRDGEQVAVRRLDDAGRIVWRQLTGDSFERFAYDGRGDLASYANGSDPAAPYLVLSYERDDAGRVTARTWAYGAIHDRDQFAYVCE